MELGGLIVGLGNPGPEYRDTRHNFGFMVIEALVEAAEKQDAVRQLSGRKDPFILWRCPLPGASRPWLLAEPLTYMNRSGEAVQRIAAYYRIEVEDILVVQDELDLPLGRMKLKQGGGNAGHKGIASIEQLLGSPNFYRLRLGVGKAGDGVARVLGRFAASELQGLRETVAAAVTGVGLFASRGPAMAVRYCNAFRAPSLESAAVAPEKARE